MNILIGVKEISIMAAIKKKNRIEFFLLFVVENCLFYMYMYFQTSVVQIIYKEKTLFLKNHALTP